MKRKLTLDTHCTKTGTHSTLITSGVEDIACTETHPCLTSAVTLLPRPEHCLFLSSSNKLSKRVRCCLHFKLFMSPSVPGDGCYSSSWIFVLFGYPRKIQTMMMIVTTTIMMMTAVVSTPSNCNAIWKWLHPTQMGCGAQQFSCFAELYLSFVTATQHRSFTPNSVRLIGFCMKRKLIDNKVLTWGKKAFIADCTTKRANCLHKPDNEHLSP